MQLLFSSTGDRTFIGGLRTWSGSYECLMDDTNPVLSDASNLGVGSTPTTSDIITLNAASGRSFYGVAIVTGVHPNVAVDGVMTVTYDFQGTGALTIV